MKTKSGLRHAVLLWLKPLEFKACAAAALAEDDKLATWARKVLMREARSAAGGGR